VLTTWSTGNPAFVSKDGNSTYAGRAPECLGRRPSKVLDATRPQVESIADRGSHGLRHRYAPISKDISIG